MLSSKSARGNCMPSRLDFEKTSPQVVRKTRYFKPALKDFNQKKGDEGRKYE